MSVRTHLRVTVAMFAAWFTGFLVVLGLALRGSGLTIGLWWILGGLLLFAVVLYLVPVRCQKPGCRGLMRRIWLGERDFRVKYECRACGDVYK